MCGFIAIIVSLDITKLPYAPYFIFIAAVFDFCDGFAARAFKAYSEFGKQLDSLADVVSFGVAPGVIVYQLFHLLSTNLIMQESFSYPTIIVISSIIPVFSALRLAKFNIDERQSESFIGLPTPASAILIASITIVAYDTKDYALTNFILNRYTIIVLVLFIAFLMVSELPMFSMKFKNLSIKENLTKYIFLLLSIILLLTFRFNAVPLVIMLYIVISLIIYLNNQIRQKTK